MSDINPGLILATVVMAVACVGILAVAVVAVVIDRRDQRPAEAYECGWADGVIDALKAHGPTVDDPDLRLLWVGTVQRTEPNPYGEIVEVES